jgi:hypothetical protein
VVNDGKPGSNLRRHHRRLLHDRRGLEHSGTLKRAAPYMLEIPRPGRPTCACCSPSCGAAGDRRAGYSTQPCRPARSSQPHNSTAIAQARQDRDIGEPVYLPRGGATGAYYRPVVNRPPLRQIIQF